MVAQVDRHLPPACWTCKAPVCSQDAVQVICDGEEIELPNDIEGILVINIPSYMGGVALWAHSSGSCMSASPQPQSFSDGMVEVRDRWLASSSCSL